MTHASSIEIAGLGKMYKLYRRPLDKVLDVFGLARWTFWRRAETRYREFWALRDVNLTVRRGERLGIIGRNGAGKSTLLKVITGNLAPTEGSVQVRGRIQALLELGTGFHPEFTGRENIRASLAYHGLSGAEIRAREEEIIDFAELDEFIDQPVKTYSAGMYARLAFSTATAIEPEILIIDEVLGAGDAYFAGKCVERMKTLTEESGATVLIVSHDLSTIQRLCSRAVWVDRGKIRQSGEPLDVIKLYSAMVRHEEDVRLRARDQKVLKKQAMLLDSLQDVYDKLLFRLVPAAGGRPRGSTRVYEIALALGGDEIGRIDVGCAMDNSPDHQHYVLDTPRYMDWGPPDSDRHGRYRVYGDFQGRYAHAPFEFAIPKSYRAGAAQSALRLRLLTSGGEPPVAVELYHHDEYVRLGCVQPGERSVSEFSIPAAVLREVGAPLPAESAAGEVRRAEAQPVQAAQIAALARSGDAGAPREPAEGPLPESASEYGAGGARIVAARLYDALGRECRVLHTGQALRVVLEFETDAPLINPVFVFCVYLPDGQCATQWIVTSEELGAPTLHGRGDVTFRVERLLLGRSAYVASAAIFKYLSRDGREAESYHVLDRCIHFQVHQPLSDVLERGLCVQPFEASLHVGADAAGAVR